MSDKSYKEGFKKGFNQLQLKDVQEATIELMQALGINNRVSWGAYKNGNIEPKASQALAVEKVFAKYGIKEVWGE